MKKLLFIALLIYAPNLYAQGCISSSTCTRSDGTRTGSDVWEQARDAGVKINAADHDTHDQKFADALTYLAGTASTWEPTLTASGSMTYTSTTVNVAQYVYLPAFKLCWINLDFTGTTGGTASTVIISTLPITPSAISAPLTALIHDGGSSWLVGTGSIGVSDAHINFRIMPNIPNWGLGADRSVSVQGWYKTQ